MGIEIRKSQRTVSTRHIEGKPVEISGVHVISKYNHGFQFVALRVCNKIGPLCQMVKEASLYIQ